VIATLPDAPTGLSKSRLSRNFRLDSRALAIDCADHDAYRNSDSAGSCGCVFPGDHNPRRRRRWFCNCRGS